METTTELGLQDIMTGLEAEYTGKLPDAAMRAAQRRSEEIAPFLIDAIRKATEAVRTGAGVPNDAALFSFFLLAEFRAPEALPVIVEALSLPGDGPFTLFGDAITEELSSILAALAADTPTVVDELIANQSLNLFVRWSAAKTYLYWVRDERLSREAAVNRLREHVQQAIVNGDTDGVTGLIAELASYAPHEARDVIKEAYDRELVDETFVDFNFVEESIVEGESRLQEELQRCPPTGVSDAVAELNDWYAFQEPVDVPDAPDSEFAAAWDTAKDVDFDQIDEGDPWAPPGTIRHTAPRVSRNDPCPCGSGKKFKKCCAAR